MTKRFPSPSRRPAQRTTRLRILLAILVTLGMLGACRSRDREEQPATPQASAATAELAAAPQTDPAAVPAEPLNAPTPAPTATTAPQRGIITLWHSWSQADGDALALILEDFNRLYPEVQVETLFVAYNDLLQSYAQAVAEGSGPDLVLAPNWWLSDLTMLGAVQRLDDRVSAQHLDTLWPAAVDNLRMEGALYGLPVHYEVVALYYNRSLLPADALPATLDELLAYAQQQPANGIGVYANPFHLAWGFPAFGGAIFDGGGRAILDQTDGAARFLAWLAAVNALNGSYVDTDYGMLLDRFKKGEFAFFVDGPWALSELSAVLGDSLGVMPLPPGPAAPAQPWLYADAIYVNPNASPEQASLALLLAEHITGPTSGATLALLAGRLSANRNADTSADARLSGFAQQAAAAQAMPHGPHMDAFWRYGGDMIFKALTGAEDLNAIVLETATLINETTGR